MVLPQVAASLPVTVATKPPPVVITIPLTVKPWHIPQFIIEAGKPGGAVGAMAACAVAAKIISIPQNNIACSIFVLVFIDTIISFLLGFNLVFICEARIQVETG